MLYSIVGILVIILDQLVKFWVDKNINEGNVIELIPKVLSLVRVQNDGAAFSFLSGGSARIWFIILTAVFALLVVLALATNFVSGRFGRWCLVLITAGGLSNMIDRIRFGYVIDMFKIELFDFAVFNVADIFIAVFCIAFILYILFGGEKIRDPDADEFEEDEDYEEEIRPRRGRGAASGRRSGRYDDEEDEEEEESQPRSRRKTKPVREEEEFEEEEQSLRRPRPQRGAAASAAAKTVSSREEAPSRQPQQRTRSRAEEPAGDSEQVIRQRARAASQESERNASAARSRAAGRSNDAMFEEMFAHKDTPAQPTAQPARRSSAPAPKSSASRASSGSTEDPFAEWEKANARVREDAKASYRKATEAAAKSSREVRDASQDAFSDFLDASSKPAPAKRPASSKTASSAPRQSSAPRPAPKKSTPAPAPEPDVSNDFDLDSILNEFK